MTEIIEKNHFSLVNVREIPEMQGSLYEMVHEKSGAKLAWLHRPDENMTFAIGFRTIPTDSTGVFHILEHSVLNGSRKYPVKEPFVELLKSSLQTFLNAMTYPDKTIYPVSSRNKQDFHNLMDIYMDAVLHPLAVTDDKVFHQEGWRLELDEEGAPIFQGVVYNEMKGAFSDVNRIVERKMMEHLFPDTCYRHCSGGDPAVIPELSFEHFVSEHQKYYHPSSALIVLDGDVDLDDCLSLLDGFLSDYDSQPQDFPIPLQQPLPYQEERIAYEISPEESDEDKTIFSFGKLLCGYQESVKLHAASLLADFLAGDTEAPLKRAVLDAGLAADFQVSLNDGLQQAWFGWQAWNTREDKLPELKKVIRETVEGILKAGLDRQRLLGCYNFLAFKLLARDNYGYPRGLVEALTMLEPWLYGGDPAKELRYRCVLEDLRNKLDSGFLEELLRQLFLEQEDGFLAIMVPDASLGQQRVAQERQRVERYYQSLDETQRQQLPIALEAFHQWQQTPDSQEALSSIPVLSLTDIAKEPAPITCAQTRVEEVPVLLHETGSDLVYINLYFSASDALPEEMPLVNLLGELLSNLDTARHTASQLQTALRQYTGSLVFGSDILHRDERHHSLYFSASLVCLSDYREQAVSLLTEILTTTRFWDADAVKKMLLQKKTENQQRLISMGSRYAASRVSARQTSAGAAKELYGGCEYIRWVNRQCAREEVSDLLQSMEQLCRKFFCRSRLTVSVSSNAEALVPDLVAAFPQGGAAPENAAFPLLPSCREGILISAGVGYAAKGIHLEGEFSGAMYVLSNLLTYSHLWNEVRVKGGAYGTGFRVDADGDWLATSYRDPNPGRSLAVFDDCEKAVAQVCEGTTDLTRYILGSMADADPLLSAAKKLRLAELRHFRGIDQEEVSRRWQTLVNCQPEDLRALCSKLKQMAQKGSICIVAGQQQLDSCKALVDTVVDNLE